MGKVGGGADVRIANDRMIQSNKRGATDKGHQACDDEGRKARGY